MHGDPINRIDPSGLWDLFVFFAYGQHLGPAAAEWVGIVGYNSETGFYGADIVASGVHVDYPGGYAAAFHGIETTTDGHTVPISICEAAEGIEIPGVVEVGAGAGAYVTNEQGDVLAFTDGGGFSFVEGGILGKNGAVGIGGSLPILNWVFE